MQIKSRCFNGYYCVSELFSSLFRIHTSSNSMTKQTNLTHEKIQETWYSTFF